ncbi:MAG: lanthionine synthetase LanC family protein, partial [Kofleriaceae bacterium]
MTWRPLLDGALADQASAAVLDIARAIASGEGNPAKVTDRTLFWAYMAGAFDDGWIADAYDRAVAELVEDTPRWFAELGLYSGAACVGFTIAHVSEPGAADASLAAIDEVIADALAVEAWTRDYDLISGLAGIGIYLLERGDVAAVAIDRVVDHLIAT